jgi:hypothetical protein
VIRKVDKSEEYPPDEAVRRRDELARRILKTPPQPHNELRPKKRKAKRRAHQLDAGR